MTEIQLSKSYLRAIADVKSLLADLGGTGADPETWSAGWDDAITAVEVGVDKLSKEVIVHKWRKFNG